MRLNKKNKTLFPEKLTNDKTYSFLIFNIWFFILLWIYLTVKIFNNLNNFNKLSKLNNLKIRD